MSKKKAEVKAEITEVTEKTEVKVKKKSTTTFVAACYNEFVANTLTVARYKEIAAQFNTAQHRYKAYVKYFKNNRYVATA